MKKITRGKIEKSYIAGLVDGEGCIGIYRRNYKNEWSPRYDAYAAITNTNQDVLVWVQKLYGGYLSKKKRYNNKHTQGYSLQIRNTDLKVFLKEILPYLRIKKDRAMLVLEFWERMHKFFGDYGRSKQRVSEEELEKREHYYQRSLNLNHPQRLTKEPSKEDVIV